MFLISEVPIVTPDDIYSSNIAIPSNAWNSGTTYVRNDVVYTGTPPSEEYWQCMVGPATSRYPWIYPDLDNVNNDPATNPAVPFTEAYGNTIYLEAGQPWWGAVGVNGIDNRYRAFDLYVNTTSDADVGDNTCEWVLKPTQKVDTVAFLNLEAESVTVTLQTGVGTPIETQTVSLTRASPLFDTLPRASSAVITLATAYDPAVHTHANPLKVVVTNTSATAKVGKVFCGRIYQIGETQAGSVPGDKWYGDVQEDTWGRVTIKDGEIADKGEFEILVDTARIQEIREFLNLHRGEPMIYKPYSNSVDAMVYGFHTNFRPPLQQGPKSFATLEVRGLV